MALTILETTAGEWKRLGRKLCQANDQNRLIIYLSFINYNLVGELAD